MHLTTAVWRKETVAACTAHARLSMPLPIGMALSYLVMIMVPIDLSVQVKRQLDKARGGET